MTILLLGGTGYLGGNIAKSFSNKGHRVICTARRTSNISYLNGLDNVEIISNELGQIELTLKRSKIDWVINGVCTYKPNDSLYGDMFLSNVEFPLSVLNLSIKNGIKKYLTVGTALPEDFNLYSFTKHKFSDFGRFLSQKDGVTFIDLNLEMFYGGENEPLDRFMNSCRNKLLKSCNIELTSGKQKRDIVRVEDVTEIMHRLITVEGIEGYRILPVGSGEQHSIIEIVSFMKKTIGSKSELRFGKIPDREGEPNTLADVSWYESIDYHNKYSFFEGIKDFCCKSGEA